MEDHLLLHNERKSYANKWKINANLFKEQKLYEWMVDQVKIYSPELIFDVGSGDGTALISLVRRLSNNVKIISIDENPECLKVARKNLENAGISVELIERLNTISINSKLYSLQHLKIIGNFDKQITLIESDIITDAYLASFLLDFGKFDLVTIWLIGTHPARDHCLNLSQLDMQSSENYRLLVQNKVYELADMILKQDGILQVVDRTECPKNKLLRDDLLNSHKDQASVTSLKVSEIAFIPYEDSQSEDGIEMEISPAVSGRMPEKIELAITSVISIK